MSSAHRYHTRSPRYLLRPEDRSLMRFAGMETRGSSVTTQVQDLSETGLSFTIHGELTPHEGDMLKVEFTVPDRNQIACFATVVRVEERKEWDPTLGPLSYNLVAIQFRNLPAAHHRALQAGLRARTDNETDGLLNDSKTDGLIQQQHDLHKAAFCTLSILFALVLFILAQSPNAWLIAIRSTLSKNQWSDRGSRPDPSPNPGLGLRWPPSESVASAERTSPDSISSSVASRTSSTRTSKISSNPARG